MLPPDDLKTQRDRFLAFSFAAADLLLEISKDGAISYASGAMKSLAGHEESALLGKDWLSIFDTGERALLQTLKDSVKPGVKKGPYLVSLKTARSDGQKQKAFVSGLAMPAHGGLYLALTLGTSLLRIMGFEQEEDKKPVLLDKQAFGDSVRKALEKAKLEGKEVDVTFLEVKKMDSLKENMDSSQWDSFTQSIADILVSSSIDGESAARMEDGKYCLVHDESISKDALQKQIQDISKESDPRGVGVEVGSMSIDADLVELNGREASRALSYTIDQFEKEGMGLSVTSLQSAFKNFLSANAAKIKYLKSVISTKNFTLNFQPIVDMKNYNVMHYEVLIRFKEGESPYDLIVFGEEIGISPDLDIAVCEKALDYLDLNSGKSGARLAINLSGMSIQNEKFTETLFSMIKKYERYKSQILFEITESAMISNLDQANGFIQRMRAAGYKICLDDFGSGSASFQYLHKLHVDIVKIDGAYIKNILDSPRDATLVKNLTQMCHELNMEVIAEMIETREQANYLRDIGIDHGQGWYYAKPRPSLTYRNRF